MSGYIIIIIIVIAVIYGAAGAIIIAVFHFRIIYVKHIFVFILFSSKEWYRNK